MVLKKPWSCNSSMFCYLCTVYRLGQVENARHHLFSHTQQANKTELQKLSLVEKHINQCADARKIGDWKSTLRECDAAMLAGADSSPQVKNPKLHN